MTNFNFPGGDHMPGSKSKPQNSSYPKGSGPQAPAWVAFDRQVLCFDAYFQEAVHEKREEKNRIRKCKIYFYLEDDTIQVIERKVENSGIPQGTLIRRHRIPLPPPNDEEFYTCLLYTSPSPRDQRGSRMPSSA